MRESKRTNPWAYKEKSISYCIHCIIILHVIFEIEFMGIYFPRLGKTHLITIIIIHKVLCFLYSNYKRN